MVNDMEKLFYSMDQFRRLRIGDLIPEITKCECVMMMELRRACSERADNKLTVSELSRQIQVKPSAVSRALRNLEEKEYVLRTVNKEDRRNTYVQLTDAGSVFLQRIDGILARFAQAVSEKLDEREVTVLIETLNHIYQVARAEIEAQKIVEGDTEK